jgi:hypothetical protein
LRNGTTGTGELRNGTTGIGELRNGTTGIGELRNETTGIGEHLGHLVWPKSELQLEHWSGLLSVAGLASFSFS